MTFSMNKMFLTTIFGASLFLTACGGMDDPYRTASGTAVYRVEWRGSIGYLTDANGESVGKIHAEDMRDYNGYSVNGHSLDGYMYYNRSGNRLFLEDSDGGVGRSINSATASQADDGNWPAMTSESREEIIEMVAEGLEKTYALPPQRAKVVASALQGYHETQVERGYSTDADVEVSFKQVFGVSYNSALAAAKSFQAGNPQEIRALTDRSASHLGIPPHQAKKFIKDMYRKTLERNGYDADTLNW